MNDTLSLLVTSLLGKSQHHESQNSTTGSFRSIYDRNYNVVDIEADKLTHILYAFANVNETGAIDLGVR